MKITFHNAMKYSATVVSVEAQVRQRVILQGFIRKRSVVGHKNSSPLGERLQGKRYPIIPC